MKKVYIVVGITNTINAGLKQFIFPDEKKWYYNTPKEAEAFLRKIKNTESYLNMKQKVQEIIFQIQESYIIE